MKEWFTRFLTNEGKRLVYLIIAITGGAILMAIGYAEQGLTIIIGGLTLALNRARSEEKKG